MPCQVRPNHNKNKRSLIRLRYKRTHQLFSTTLPLTTHKQVITILVLHEKFVSFAATQMLTFTTTTVIKVRQHFLRC